MRFFFIFILFLPTFLFAQRKVPKNLPKYDEVKLHFGMALGGNSMRATIHNSADFYQLDSVYSVECIPQSGLNINIVSNLNINKYFSLRFLPGLNFGQRNMEYIYYTGVKFRKHTMQITSTYLDFPILFQVKTARLNNFRMYGIGGWSYKWDLAAQRKLSDEEGPKIKFTPQVYSYEIGAGMDFFLQYFKFAIEMKFVVGINNVLVYDNSQFTTSMERLTPKMFSISLLFEGSDSKGGNFWTKWFKKKK